MLSFDFGYLVVLGAVVVILFVYRQLDKNNRSLEKIRKFAENVRHELNTFVEERTAAVKDFETVLKVHDKTAVEILRRIQAVESNLLTRTPEIEALQARLDRYATSVADLDAQTAKVDGNLDRLREETVFVDKVTQKIKSAGEQMKALETAFGQIRQEFADINQKDLETVRKNAVEVFEKETLAYVQQLREAQKQVEGFQTLVGELESRQKDIIADTETGMKARAEAVLEETEAAFRETARQADDLSSVVFLKLEERIEGQAAASENRLRSELEAREASVRDGIGALQDRLGEVDTKVAEGTAALNALLESARQETQVVEARTQKDLEALQGTVRGAAEQLRRDFQTEQAQLLSMTAELRSDLDANLAQVRTQNEAEAQALRVEFQSSLELDRQGARDVETRLKDDLATLQSTLKNASEQLRRDFQTEQTQLLTMTAQLKADLEARLAAVSEETLASVELDRRNTQAADARRQQELEAAQAAFRTAAEQLRGDFEAEQKELLQKTADLKSDLVLSLAAVSTELQTSLEQERQSARAVESRTKEELDALQSLFQEGADRLQRDFAAEQERLAAMTAELKTDLDRRLAAVRGQSIEDAEALRAELQTALEATRENTQGFEAQTQQNLDTLGSSLNDAAEELRRRFQSEQAQLLDRTAELKADLDQRLAAVRSQSLEDADALRAEFQASLEATRGDTRDFEALTQQNLGELGSTLNNAAEQLRRSFLSEQAQLLDMTNQLKSDLDLRLADLRSQSVEESEALRSELQTSLDRARESVEGFEARTRQEMESLQAAFDSASERLRQGFQSEQSQLFSMTTQLKSDLDLRLAGVRSQTVEEAEALRAELQATLEGDRQNAQLLVSAVREALATARRETKEGEQAAIEALEARLKDYETGFAYRYGKMEEAEKDLASLDTNLRQAMDRVEERIHNDFALFDQAMLARRDEEQAAVEKKLEAVQTSMVRLDRDLEELKTRAYDNVSEKLQGFEEEFFADLQRRNASMTQSLEDWQSSLQAQLGDLTQDAARDRAEVERLVSEALKARVQELQNTSFQQLDRLERQIQEAQETTGASVSAYRAEVEDTRTRLVDELVELERVLETRFEQDRARATLAANEALTHLERDLDAKTKLIADNFELFRADYQASQNGVQSEFSLWQTKFGQRFKELEADLDEQQRAFRTTLSENISAIADEFSRQKEELVSRSAEDRLALRNDLVQIKSGIEELETALRIRSQTAIDALEREYEDLSADFQKKNRELVADIENKIRDYRAQVVDNREGAEAMNKKLVAKIEDQANLLTVTLEEIDKRQKGFIAQTKVFERADTMKQELQEAIEDLKGDLARIEIQRKDLFEIETSVARIKKLGDETTEKVARFTADKKRIDLMDADFQRILGLSQSMEVRLEQVSSSHDLLQDIQLRIRKLEDYSKDIETRYERLEKRREVLDTTTDGVDRNFALLERTEKTVRGLDAELKSMPAEVEDLRKRLKVLSQGKEDADKAVERLTTLDQTLREVETRIGRMEQAREWLAGVETRLTETKAAAEEQVQTLATITKAAGGPSVKAKAADSDLRQTVLKLARQGWGKEEISRATKLSMGEVELILELGSR